MNPLTWPLGLPLRPLRSVVGLAETIGEQAERELRDPARVRRELGDAQRRAAAGEISDEELSEIENAAMARLIPSAVRGPSPAARRRAERS
jgi:hypothetical protein